LINLGSLGNRRRIGGVIRVSGLARGISVDFESGKPFGGFWRSAA
jgi:hypothetical protein